MQVVFKLRAGQISRVPGVLDIAEDKVTVTVTVTGTPLLKTAVPEGEMLSAYSSGEEDEPKGVGRRHQQPWQQEGTTQVLQRFPRTANGAKLLMVRNYQCLQACYCSSVSHAQRPLELLHAL